LGVAYAEFKSEEVAATVVEQLNGKELNSRALQLKFNVPYKPKQNSFWRTLTWARHKEDDTVEKDTNTSVAISKADNAVDQSGGNTLDMGCTSYGRNDCFSTPNDLRYSIEEIVINKVDALITDWDIHRIFDKFIPVKIDIVSKSPKRLSSSQKYVDIIVAVSTATHTLEEIIQEIGVTRFLGHKLTLKPSKSQLFGKETRSTSPIEPSVQEIFNQKLYSESNQLTIATEMELELHNIETSTQILDENL